MKKNIDREVGALRRQIQELSEQVTALTEASAEDLEDTIADYVEEVGDEVGARYEKVKGAARKAVDRSRHYVEEHPFQSIGMGLALGFLAGFLLRRRE